MTSQRYQPVPSELIPDFPSWFLISSFQDLRYPLSMFNRCLSLWKLGPHIHLSKGTFWWMFHGFSWPFPLPVIEDSLLDHDLPWLPLPDACLPAFLLALQSRWKCAPSHLKHPTRETDDPSPSTDKRELTAPTSECSRKPVPLGLVLRIFKNQTASPHTSRLPDAHPRKFEGGWNWESDFSHAPSVPTPPDRPDWSRHTLSHLLVLRHRGLPAFNSRLEFEKRASFRRNDRTKMVSLPSPCCEIRPLLQSLPRLQGALARVGNNVVLLVNCDVCKDCMHLIRTDTALDQDCEMKANVHVCTTCMIVSLLTTCLNLSNNCKKKCKYINIEQEFPMSITVVAQRLDPSWSTSDQPTLMPSSLFSSSCLTSHCMCQHSPSNERLTLSHFLKLFSLLPLQRTSARSWRRHLSCLQQRKRLERPERKTRYLFREFSQLELKTKMKMEIQQTAFSVTSTVAQFKELTLTRRRQKTANETTFHLRHNQFHVARRKTWDLFRHTFLPALKPQENVNVGLRLQVTIVFCIPYSCKNSTDSSAWRWFSFLRPKQFNNALLPSSQIWILRNSNPHAHQRHYKHTKTFPNLLLLQKQKLPNLESRSLQHHLKSLSLSNLSTRSFKKLLLYVSQKCSSIIALYTCTSPWTLYCSSPRSFSYLPVYERSSFLTPSWK